MSIKPPKGCISESDSRVAQFGHPAPAWLFPYADLMTELVCFFVILYALSASLDKDIQKGHEEIQEVMTEEKVAGGVEVTQDGLVVTLKEEQGVSNFESGFAELTPRMREVLGRIGPPLKAMADRNKMILVQGYTDDIPIKNEYFYSNWELSSSRATAVVEYLINELKLPPACLAAAGYGEHQPVCTEKTRECRSRNRRIVFLVRASATGNKNCSGQKASPPAESSGEAEL